MLIYICILHLYVTNLIFCDVMLFDMLLTMELLSLTALDTVSILVCRKPTRGRLNQNPSLFGLKVRNEEHIISHLYYRSLLVKTDCCSLFAATQFILTVKMKDIASKAKKHNKMNNMSYVFFFFF